MNNWIRIWLAILVIALGLPAIAHDPLREDDEDHHQHGVPPFATSNANISDVRSLVLSFRETGDDTALDEAWSILLPALEASPDDPELLIAAAHVAQSRHDFSHAVALIKRALAIRPDNDEGWLLLASIHLVGGESGQAADACARLRHALPLTVLTCKARVALANGDHGLASSRLEGVLRVIDTRHVPVDVLAWSYSVAADLAVASGNLQHAEALYSRSLALGEKTQVRAALVDVLLAQRKFDEAWQILDAGAPALPLLVRRLIAAKQTDRLTEVQAELAKVEREFAVWIANEDWLHAREMARFFIDVVDRPDLARRLAIINIGLQQEPEDLRLEKRTRPVDAS